MTERVLQQAWVDRYVRGDLTTEEMLAFETKLLESSTLQQELEIALALQAALKRGRPMESSVAANDHSVTAMPPRAQWQHLAMAATLVLAVLSTVMWWKSGAEIAGLERELQGLMQPRGDVLTVAVPVMRSAGSQTPDVIVQKPAGQSAILLDIELGLAARGEAELNLALLNSEDSPILSWQGNPTPEGHASAVIASERIPSSLLWLEISKVGGEVLERRLLEFR